MIAKFGSSARCIPGALSRCASSQAWQHISVLPAEINKVFSRLPQDAHGISYLVDGTVGGGGHAEALLAAHPGARLLGIDRDPDALAAASARLAKFGDRATLVQGSYAQVQRLLRKASWPAQVHGILLDLGVSSWQLDAAHRGFSYARDGPLDMRFDQQAAPSAQTPTAADLVNGLPEVELMRIFRDMGDEPHAALVARAVVATRAQWAAAARAAGDTARAEAPIQTTAQLTDIVERTALRIAVNAELAHFHQFMQHVPSVLAPGASLAVITFQPTETAMLRKHMKLHVRQHRMHTPTWLPAWMVPAADEVQANPRARTARLGVLTRAGDS